MESSSFATRISLILAAALIAGTSLPAVAADQPWWQRIEGYAVLGAASVRATPDSGGTITASFNDNTTVGTDKSLLIEGGRNSSDYLPMGTLGARFYLFPTVTLGLEAEGFSFSDAVAEAPRDAPGTTPLPNFATYREESLFKLDGSDITATAGYSRWGITAEGQVGRGNGSFRTRSELYTFGVFTTGNFVNLNLSNGTTFKGDGLVYGLRLAYAVPRLPITVLGRYKHSKLKGETDAFGSSAGTVASSPSAPLVGAATVTRNNADATGKRQDMEFGLQYDFAPASRFSSFVRISYTQSELKIRGLPTGGAGFGGTIGDLTTNSFSSAGMSTEPSEPGVGKAAGKLTGIKFAVGVEF
jgi:hypothetical protein